MTTTKIEELQQKLTQAVEDLTTGEDWQEYLNVASKFWSYSWRNQMLIAAQYPTATRVMGYGNKAGTTGWKSLNRFVRKGEKGIGILAPQFFKCRQCLPCLEGKTAKECRDQNISFRQVYVFDVSQTEGDPLPEGVSVELLAERDGMDAVLATIEKMIPLDYELVYETIPGETIGYCSFNDRKIVVDVNLSTTMKCRTLTHEITHSLLHEKVSNRALCETEAESVAYIVLGALGIETDQYSFGYVAHWSEGKDEIIRETAKNITKTAKGLIERYESLSAELLASVG